MSTQDSPQTYTPSEIYSPDSGVVWYVTQPKRRYWLHLLLLLLTFFTTLVVGSRMEWNYQQGLPPFSFDDGIFPLTWALQGRHLLLGIPFSLTLMLILLAHEMLHYFDIVKYCFSLALSFFIHFQSLFL